MTGTLSAVADDYEALCAERGEALTLRFAGDDRHIDLVLTGATVGRLDYQWRMGRRGLWVLPLRSDEADAAQVATDGADFLQGAPGGLILRVVGFGDDLEYRIEGRLGFSQCDEDTAAAGPSGAAGAAGGVDFDRAHGAVCEANPAGEVEVVGRQANLSCSVMRAGVDAESGPGETSAPAERGATA